MGNKHIQDSDAGDAGGCSDLGDLILECLKPFFFQRHFFNLKCGNLLKGSHGKAMNSFMCVRVIQEPIQKYK